MEIHVLSPGDYFPFSIYKSDQSFEGSDIDLASNFAKKNESQNQISQNNHSVLLS